MKEQKGDENGPGAVQTLLEGRTATAELLICDQAMHRRGVIAGSDWLGVTKTEPPQKVPTTSDFLAVSGRVFQQLRRKSFVAVATMGWHAKRLHNSDDFC